MTDAPSPSAPEPPSGAPDRLAPATVVVTAGRPPRAPGAPVNPPVELSSTYAAWPAELGRTGYGRSQNATWDAFEGVVGELEGGAALVFASGMAAIAAALSVAPADRPILAPTTPYNATSALLEEYACAGRDVRRAPVDDTGAFLAALAGSGRPGGPAGTVWLESPTNPLLQVADLPTLISAAHHHGAVVICDNTFATPLLQRPLAWGADMVVHSVTKYLAGHSDLLLGATVTHPDRGDLHEALVTHRTRHGAIAGPMETWLALRGIRTLQVRFERAAANAAELARRLAGHPAVARVRWPGSGAMLAVDVAGDPDDPEPADRVVAALRLWNAATSLGGVESLGERRRRYPGESPLVPESLLRLSVGIEDIEDLWRDLDQALQAAVRSARVFGSGT